MDIAIGMTTAPRKKPTLTRAIASLRKGGFSEEVHVFAEPGSFDRETLPPDGRLRLHANSTKRGCFGNWKHACITLLETTSEPWIMIVQDDAIWKADAAIVLRAKMQERQDVRTGFLSLYASPMNVKGSFKKGWNKSKAGWGFWGALALCMKRVAAQELLEAPRFRKHKGPQQVDAVVGASMRELDRPCFLYIPSLVDHIGITSTIGNGGRSPGRQGYRFSEKA